MSNIKMAKLSGFDAEIAFGETPVWIVKATDLAACQEELAQMTATSVGQDEHIDNLQEELKESKKEIQQLSERLTNYFDEIQSLRAEVMRTIQDSNKELHEIKEELYQAVEFAFDFDQEGDDAGKLMHMIRKCKVILDKYKSYSEFLAAFGKER